MDAKKYLPVYDFLPAGRANAVPLRLIMQRFGLSNREARREISRERKSGALILSSVEGAGGYFRPEPCDAGELERFAASMRSRGLECLYAAQLAAQAARDTREAVADFEAAGRGTECQEQKTVSSMS